MIVMEPDEKIIKIALHLLPEVDVPTPEMLRTAIQLAKEMFHRMNPHVGVEDVDEGRLVKKIEALCDVHIPAMSSLDDMHDHQEWLPSRRAEIQWRFWERYKRYLENDPALPPQAVRRLDEITDQILSRLEYPLRSDPWDRRGMVVGQVQSGKTSNYIGLICKAADAGYKLIIVLAGLHNSLRSQTQLRLDEGFLGFDTQRRILFDPNGFRLGAGLLPGSERCRVHSLTSSLEAGDFNLKVARQANIMIGGADPVLLVVKKNASVLKNLLKWSTLLKSTGHDKSHSLIQDVPLLLIDDEADNASINTNPILDENGNPDPELDPTKINGLIRKLLKGFEQSAYIGYTATPFANIFIADKDTREEFGEDLFPRSFIMNLQPPSNYIGPAKLFGLTTDQETASGLPLIRHVDDYLQWIPDKHKKEHLPESLPASVTEAIKAFILTCAIRQARGQTHKHNSMLIHVTRFTNVQSHVADQVKDVLFSLQQRLRYGDGHASNQVIDEFKALWDTNFEPTMHMFRESDLLPVTWDQVKDVLHLAASKIEIKKINGTARDTLQYIDHRDGLSVICIGGDKLSRGLTLYGLSISYYLRASKMYDTLMQMGRWFGYREGYADLCRLYTTSELEGWYRDITAADEELRQMFEDMAAQEKTPEEYGLGVRTHPELLITAMAKMRSGQKLMLSYSQRIVETVVFFDDTEKNRLNVLTTERLLREVNTRYIKRKKGGSHHVWDRVHGEVIVDFLDDYITHETARTVRASILNKYIQSRMFDGELIEWTIALISKQHTENVCTIADLCVGLTERERVNDSLEAKYRIRRLVNPTDERIDLSDEEVTRAIKETQKRWEPGKSKDKPDSPSGIVTRQIRPARRGLLLLYALQYHADSSRDPIIGFAISFPKSDRGEASAIEFMVNNTYVQQELGSDR